MCRKGRVKPIKGRKKRRKGKNEKNARKEKIRNGCNRRAVGTIKRVDTGSIAEYHARDDSATRDREWGIVRATDGVLVAEYAA